MVGCVIAHGEEIVGEGWHQRKGGPHAEVFALQAAGERARGATAYVTLEPCAHTGSTGPCADALIAAGVARVVAAMRDPFPQVDGAGFEKLRAAGIAVESRLDGSAGARSSTAASCRASNAVGPGCGSSWRPASTAAPRWPAANRNGSAARPRATTCIAGARARARSSPARAPCWPTIRSSPCASAMRHAFVAAAARGARSGPGHGRARPRARRRCADALPACARRQAAAATSTPSMPRSPVHDGRLDLAAVLEAAGRARDQRSAGRSRRDAGRRASSPPGWSTNCCCTSRRCCSANARARCSTACASTPWRSACAMRIVETRRIGDDVRVLLRPRRKRRMRRIGATAASAHGHASVSAQRLQGSFLRRSPATTPGAAGVSAGAVRLDRRDRARHAIGRGKPGCGSGQASRDLARAFERVFATDPSAAQIAQATRSPATSRFAVEPGERCSLPDASVDAVCVAQALHWFDRDAFFAECERVLRARRRAGRLGLPGHRSARARCWQRSMPCAQRSRPYWPPERAFVDAGLCAVRLAVRALERARVRVARGMEPAAAARLFLQLFGRKRHRERRRRSGRGTRRRLARLGRSRCAAPCAGPVVHARRKPWPHRRPSPTDRRARMPHRTSSGRGAIPHRR